MFLMRPPISFPKLCALTTIPNATPACGNNVIPKYFFTFSLQCIAVLLIDAPKYLPKHLTSMYTIPMSIIDPSRNTESSSLAPDSTKNTAYNGADHLSERFIMSSEYSHMLQNTVPNVIHTSSDENAIFT